MMKWIRRGAALSVLVSLFCGAALQAVEDVPTVYVSPRGDDAWSGTAPRAIGRDGTGPVASLGRAVEVSRALRQPGVTRRRIEVVRGDNVLDHTLELGPADSGLEIVGARGNDVSLSGGRQITGWQPWKGRILQAELPAERVPDLSFRELYYRGRLMTWARVPNADPVHSRTGGFLQNESIAEADTKTLFVYPEGALRPESWVHPERAWIQFHDSLNYETQFCPLKTLDLNRRVLEAERGVYKLAKGSPFFVCGLLEELDAPGEWCVDPDQRVLYFWPPGGSPGSRDAVIVPVLESAIALKGDPGAGAWVEDVRLERLAIRDCRGRAVQATGALRLTVAACDLRNAEVGVYLGDDTHDGRITGCDITQTQGDGISILGSSKDHERVTGHVVDNNYIRDIGWGRIHNRCGGVYMHRVMRCRVSSNLIHDTPRYAIGMDVGGECEIAYNHCHHANLVTLDTSIIEAATALDWGLPTDEQMARNRQWNWGNSIHHNLIHDSGGWGTAAEGRLRTPLYSWGIYLDTHSSGWQVYSNVIYNTVLGAYMVNGGMENVLGNNVCVDGQQHQAYLSVWPKYQTTGNRLSRNLFVSSGGSASIYTVRNAARDAYAFDANLVWAQGEPPRVAGVTGLPRRNSWSGWLALGQDPGSLVADPRFVNPHRHDYRLRPDSPAFGLGFKAIDMAAIGLYASPERRTWPRPEDRVVRDATDYAPQANDRPVQAALRTYEDYAVGEAERNAHVGQEGAGTVAVSEETAAAGQRSLKFTDAAGLAHDFVPYVTYPLELESGYLTLTFDLRLEAGANLALDWRDDPYAYSLGPNLIIDPTTTTLKANGKALTVLPLGQWLGVRIRCGLGPQATGRYQLTVTLPGAAPQEFADVEHAPTFETLNCIVFMAIGKAPGAFFLDNVAFAVEPAK